MKKRKLIDFAIFMSITSALVMLGAGLWAIPLCVMLSVWSFYDGLTRCEIDAKQQQQKKAREPVAGETWVMPQGPWPSEHLVEILEVSDGWVKYLFVGSGPSEQRKRLDIFTSMYQPASGG